MTDRDVFMVIKDGVPLWLSLKEIKDLAVRAGRLIPFWDDFGFRKGTAYPDGSIVI